MDNMNFISETVIINALFRPIACTSMDVSTLHLRTKMPLDGCLKKFKKVNQTSMIHNHL